jgi:hypothetical protein
MMIPFECLVNRHGAPIIQDLGSSRYKNRSPPHASTFIAKVVKRLKLQKEGQIDNIYVFSVLISLSLSLLTHSPSHP